MMACSLIFPDSVSLHNFKRTSPRLLLLKPLLSLSYSVLNPLPGFCPSVGTVMEDGRDRSILRILQTKPLQLLQKFIHRSHALTCNWGWHLPFPFLAAVLTLACCIFQSMPIGYSVVLLFSCLLDTLLLPFAFSHTDMDNIQVLWISVACYYLLYLRVHIYILDISCQLVLL